MSASDPAVRPEPDAPRPLLLTRDPLLLDDLLRQHPDLSSEPALAAGGPVLVVVPADVRSVAAAARVVSALEEHATDLRVVVRGPSPSHLSADMIAASLGLPLVGSLRPEPRRAHRQDRGEPPAVAPRSPLAGLCGRFLDSLALEVAA